MPRRLAPGAGWASLPRAARFTKIYLFLYVYPTRMGRYQAHEDLGYNMIWSRRTSVLFLMCTDEEILRQMQHRPRRTPGMSISMIALALLASAPIAGCGGSATSGESAKSSSTVLESAKQSLASPKKVRGKILPADTNLSARERRALKQEGLLPSK